MFQPEHSNLSPFRQSVLVKWFTLGLLGALGLFLILLIVTGRAWWAVGYAIIALGIFLVVMAIYFWGAVLLGALLVAVGQGSRAPAWAMAHDKQFDIPEHDIDPGLELAAAGILVYRFGEVKPRAYFRTVPLANARAIRPFVVARTGIARPHEFGFSLTDGNDTVQFEHEFTSNLSTEPGLVMPPYRLLLESIPQLPGQRWNLRVRSGVTVVTSLRFLFVDQPEPDATGGNVQPDLLSKLLDSAVKQDAMSNTQEITLGDYADE